MDSRLRGNDIGGGLGDRFQDWDHGAGRGVFIPALALRAVMGECGYLFMALLKFANLLHFLEDFLAYLAVYSIMA